jgi:hypothetical protein
MVLKNVTIDDRDLVTIKYQGIWDHSGSYNATSVNLTGTLSSTNDPNANFTIDTRKDPLFPSSTASLTLHSTHRRILLLWNQEVAWWLLSDLYRLLSR